MANITKQTEHQIQLTFTDEDTGKRLDKALADCLTDVSRATIQGWIKSQHLMLDDAYCKPRESVAAGQSVSIDVPPIEPLDVAPENIALDIIFEDEHILVLNKPAGLVVHPGAGNQAGTLLNGLLAYHKPLEQLPRGGIVHRLDKLTSGLMVVAKSEAVRQRLIEQLAQRSVKRQYQALVYGALVAGGTVEAAIGRHPRDRKKMAVRSDGKTAITHYRIAEKYRNTTLLDVSLETGRTHQIRVHLSYKNLPLLGDPVYGKRLHLPPDASESLKQSMRTFRRQALHAKVLGFVHPVSQSAVSWQAELPVDMDSLCQALRRDASDHY